MANRPDPDAPPSARAARNVRGVLNCYGDDKRGRNTAAGMPPVRPARSTWRCRATAASCKWHHPRMTPPQLPSTSSSTSKVDKRTDNTSLTWWWPKPKWRRSPSVSRARPVSYNSPPGWTTWQKRQDVP